MASRKTATPVVETVIIKTRGGEEITLPILSMTPVDSFESAKTKRSTKNPYADLVADAEFGQWFELPADLDEETQDLVVGKIRAGGAYYGLSVKVRYRDNDQFEAPAAPRIAGWTVTGEVNHRAPKDDA